MTRTPAFRLRSAALRDLPSLLALEARFPGDRLSPRQFRHHLRNPRARLRVLTDSGVVGGYALVLFRAGSDQARLYSVVVDPGLRGRGAGAALLRDAEQKARAAGARRMRLEVRADNHAAIRLYEHAGYRSLARLPGYYQDGGEGRRYEKALVRAPA